MSKETKKKDSVKVLPKAPAPEPKVRAEVSQETASPISQGLVKGLALVEVRATGARKQHKVYVIEGAASMVAQADDLARQAVS